MGKQPNPDAMVRYCPECGLIGPVKPPARACCPDSFGISVRRWHAEKLERILERLRDARARGVTVTVPVNRPATPEEAEHAARIGACLPNGAMFDAFGRERVRYVRVIHDGTTCVVSPGDVADLVDPGRPDDYRIEDVYLSKEEFDALPEFDGF